ncbi:MAG: alpha/beta hydrolase [Verrucomicrobia bacterium]|nr:MAG: alpha/beta hydrolase [Verrucomicrobiota bacterium]
MPHFEFTIESFDGLKLHGQRWEPEAEPAAVVCLVHGLGEHCGRYGHVAEAFNQAGYALVSFDLRGHGRSEGKRGHAPNYTALMDDIFQLLETAKEHYPDVPVFLYGHSLGGNLVIHYALRRLPKLAGVIATSPLFRPAVKPPRWKMALLRSMVGLRPSLSISSGLETAALSRDSEVLQAYREDPLTHDRISARLAIDMLRNGEWNMAHATDLPCPLLLMHGNADRITSAKASREFALRADAACTLKIWDGFFHELHNDPENKKVLTYLLDWLDHTL